MYVWTKGCRRRTIGTGPVWPLGKESTGQSLNLEKRAFNNTHVTQGYWEDTFKLYRCVWTPQLRL